MSFDCGSPAPCDYKNPGMIGQETGKGMGCGWVFKKSMDPTAETQSYLSGGKDHCTGF